MWTVIFFITTVMCMYKWFSMKLLVEALLYYMNDKWDTMPEADEIRKYLGLIFDHMREKIERKR